MAQRARERPNALNSRVSADIEIKGMDTEKHNEPAYPNIAQGHGYEKEIYGRMARNSVTPADTFTNGIPNGNH